MTEASPAEPDGDPDDRAGARRATTTTHIVLADTYDELARVRTRVRSLLNGYAEHRLVDVVLVVDVLVTDAFTWDVAPRRIRWAMTNRCTRLMVEVDSVEAMAGSDDAGGSQGFSRAILESVTANWGVDRQGRWKTAWALLDLTG